MHLHSALNHLVDKLVLSLCDLNDLLDQTSTNLALQISNTVHVISIVLSLIGRINLRLDSVLWLSSKLSRRESALRLVVLVALHSLDILPALLLRPNALREGLRNLSVPLSFAVLTVVNVLHLGEHDSNTAIALDGLEVVRVLSDLRGNLLLPCVPALWPRLLDNLQAMAGECFGGLTVHRGLWNLLEFVEGAVVVVEQR